MIVFQQHKIEIVTIPVDTVQGLPEGWAMQTMRSGRTLFIDNKVKRTLIFVEILDSKIIQFCKKA